MIVRIAAAAFAAAALTAPAIAEDAPAAYQICAACHSLDAGQHGVGPSLHGLIGREAGSAEGFGGYSQALKDSTVVWNAETLDGYLAAPAEYIPGSQMPYPGVKNDADRKAIVDYLLEAASE